MHQRNPIVWTDRIRRDPSDEDLVGPIGALHPMYRRLSTRAQRRALRDLMRRLKHEHDRGSATNYDSGLAAQEQPHAA